MMYSYLIVLDCRSMQSTFKLNHNFVSSCEITYNDILELQKEVKFKLEKELMTFGRNSDVEVVVSNVIRLGLEADRNLLKG